MTQQKTSSRNSDGSDSPSGDGYEVGFGRPPSRSQFKKGQSGNPFGRPKRQESNIASDLRALLGGVLEVRTARGRRSMSREEAIVQRIVTDALRCDQKAFARFLKLAKRAGELKDLTPPYDPIVRYKRNVAQEVAELNRIADS